MALWEKVSKELSQPFRLKVLTERTLVSLELSQAFPHPLQHRHIIHNPHWLYM